MATMVLASFIPAKCWIAPEIPTAMYNSGATLSYQFDRLVMNCQHNPVIHCDSGGTNSSIQFRCQWLNQLFKGFLIFSTHDPGNDSGSIARFWHFSQGDQVFLDELSSTIGFVLLGILFDWSGTIAAQLNWRKCGCSNRRKNDLLVGLNGRQRITSVNWSNKCIF